MAQGQQHGERRITLCGGRAAAGVTDGCLSPGRNRDGKLMGRKFLGKFFEFFGEKYKKYPKIRAQIVTREIV